MEREFPQLLGMWKMDENVWAGIFVLARLVLVIGDDCLAPHSASSNEALCECWAGAWHPNGPGCFCFLSV